MSSHTTSSTHRYRGDRARLAGRCVAFSIALGLGVGEALAAGAASPVQLCLAPPSAQIPGVTADDAISGVSDALKSYLTGPGVRTEPLEARLGSQAREEAKQKGCAYVLYTKVVQERKTKSNGLLGRIAAGAVQGGASQVAANSGSVGTRVLASAAASGASYSYFSSSTQNSDKLTLTSRLESGAGKVLSEKVLSRKAGSDGEDLLTPLVEQAAENVMSTLSASR